MNFTRPMASPSLASPTAPFLGTPTDPASARLAVLLDFPPIPEADFVGIYESVAACLRSRAEGKGPESPQGSWIADRLAAMPRGHFSQGIQLRTHPHSLLRILIWRQQLSQGSQLLKQEQPHFFQIGHVPSLSEPLLTFHSPLSTPYHHVRTPRNGSPPR